MKYLVLIYGNEEIWAAQPPAWHKANARRHQALISAAGPAILGVNELEPPSRVVSIRRGPAGKPSVTDGPFQETKEIIGGYYLIEAADREEAIRLAGQIPEATDSHGGVEIWPIVASS